MDILLYCVAIITLAESSFTAQEEEHLLTTSSQAPSRATIALEDQHSSYTTIQNIPTYNNEKLLEAEFSNSQQVVIPTTASYNSHARTINAPGASITNRVTPAARNGMNRVFPGASIARKEVTPGTTFATNRWTPSPPGISDDYDRPPIRIIRRIPSTPIPQPYFDPSTQTNISAQLGMHAFLPCTIRNQNNNSISWIRTRDSHILTVDRYTFIADERFQAWHEEDTETWTLQVKYVQERDQGRYECQISTEPKMSHFVYFHVVIPNVHIPGGPDIYVKSGSTVTLKCIISGALILPEYIFWYQGTERVLPEDLKGGRQVFKERISDDTTIGTLIITQASPRDQGSYTCVPASLPTASATLHVLNAGEHPAAMHHGAGHLGSCPPPFSLLLLCLVIGWLSGKALSSSSSLPSSSCCLSLPSSSSSSIVSLLNTPTR